MMINQIIQNPFRQNEIVVVYKSNLSGENPEIFEMIVKEKQSQAMHLYQKIHAILK